MAIENRLFPGLIEQQFPFTNGRDSFRQSLGEWSIAAMLYLAHDFACLALLEEARR